MPDIESVLFTRLTGFAGLTALINKRVYPLVMPQAEGLEKKLPCIVYQKISSVPVYSHDGDMLLTEARIQFSCYAKTYAAVKALEAQMRLALSGYSDHTLTPSIDAVFLNVAIDRYDSDIETFWVIMDFKVLHK